ncbi:MAG: DUF4835 family protein [Bacteroidota bacterium]|jgi:hypothetical protein
MKTKLFFLFTIVHLCSYAQELNCNVTVIKPQVMISGPEVFQTMERTIEEFVNGRKWSKDSWNQEERIPCTIQITIEQQVNQRQFKGTIQVGSSRPVYNSDYKTPLVSVNDRDFEFTFQENSQIQWSNDQHRDNLSSVLAFYANYILAMDYDSFALEGGTDYFLLCQTIISNAQNAPESGWRSNEKGQQNRYWLIENILTQQFSPMREANYLYHRQGLDKMYTERATGLKNVSDALLLLNNVHKVKPSSYNMQVLFYAKADEVVSIFKPLKSEQKNPIADLCKRIDPGNISKYEKILLP